MDTPSSSRPAPISWQATILAVALLAFIVAVLWIGLDHGTTFTTVWAALGSVLGVVTGAIPSYFFKRQADTASAQGSKEAQRTAVYEAYVTKMAPEDIASVRATLSARNLL